MNTTYDYLSLSDERLISLCERQNYRASGPGGQKVNKTSSAFRLIFRPLDITITCQKYRSPEDNKKSALRALRKEIALCSKEPPPLNILKLCDPYLKNGLHIDPKNPVIPYIFAVICGYFASSSCDYRETSLKMGVSSSRLSRFLKEHKQLHCLLHRHCAIKTDKI